jgi:hypothetical protein
MRSILDTCVVREEVRKGDLEDALFAADFGHVLEGRARDVYQDPVRFFRNTHPAKDLCKITKAVFGRLNNPAEPGACLRLSTGFGGGKTHTLIALWHLANNIADPNIGAELLEPSDRPASVRVAGIDGEKLGVPIARMHPDASPRSLWGELAYQLGGKQLLAEFQQFDDIEASPPADLVRKMLDRGEPVLILLDEVVKYMVRFPMGAAKNLLSFIGLLSAEVAARPRTMLVITDPAAQAAYAAAAAELAEELEAAKLLDDELGRRSSDYDPIGQEAARVVARRLFESVDPQAADEAAREFVAAYRRIAESASDALPSDVTTEAYAQRMRECYPFHPRLVETAQDRLGALPAFNKSRGTLRLFARILRQLLEDQADIPLITAGDVPVEAGRIQADLLQRLNRDQFSAAVRSDCVTHASALDAEYQTDYHQRVARALLIESLPMNANAAMDRREIALATLRPDAAGHEPGEALDRLLSVAWYLYADSTGRRFQFRVEPNVNKRIVEVADEIPEDDARASVLTRVQRHYGGATFKLSAFPASPRAVPESAELKLALCDSEELAEAVCAFTDNADPDRPERRAFRNAILALAPTKQSLEEAVRVARRLMAAERIEEEAKRAEPRDKPTLQQLDKYLPSLRKQAQVRACRAFTRVFLQDRQPLTLDESYLVPEDGALGDVKGQQSLMKFLEDKSLIFKVNESIGLDLLCAELLPGATPSKEHAGAVTASSLHERALSSPRLRLMRRADPVRDAVLKGVRDGRLAVRLANGDCYDKDGCVGGPDGTRHRQVKALTTLTLSHDVLIAPMDAPCIAAWFATNDAPPPVPPPSQIPFGATADDWDTALEYASKRRLLKLTLRAQDPAAARTLLTLAQPFGARAMRLTVTAQGELKDGGDALLQISGARPSSAVKPLDTAAMFRRALSDENANYEAEMVLDFGEGGADQAAARLEQARQKAGDAVSPLAEFSEEASE